MRNTIKYIFLVLLFAIMFSSQTLYLHHQKENITFDIYNFTDSNFNWNSTYNYTKKYDSNQKINTKRITNIIMRFSDFIIHSLFEITKFVVEFGYNNPQYDFEFFMNFFIKFAYIAFFIAITPLIIPFIAICYLLIKLIWIGIYGTYIKIKKTLEE